MRVIAMGVLLQAFYCNCPSAENQQGAWWKFLQSKLPAVKAAGFTAMWLPPACKAANLFGAPSMGYDPYDYFDLGEYNQRGSVGTWFGVKDDLTALVTAAHTAGLQLYADIVINHNNGADAQELNLVNNQMMWTKFTPVSGKFPRDWTCFHPSTFQVVDEYPPFGGMPQLCHQHPVVYSAVMEYAQRMIEEIGFDGFRFDYVKGFGPWMIKAISERRFNKSESAGPGSAMYKPFCVGEYWDSEVSIEDWLNLANSFNDNPVTAFDFPLRYHLKDLCDTYGYDLRGLLAADSVLMTEPDSAVTFVDNHDTTQNPGDAVINDKLLAYAFILTHQGYPCVFWPDYFNYGLSRTGTANGLDALIAAHERYAGGDAANLWADATLYIMQRSGYASQPGLVLVLNNRGDIWNGATVKTQWMNGHLTPVAWDGNDQSRPEEKYTGGDGSVDLYAAPRGWVVYAPA
jgi:alpha-amylase